MVGIKELLKQGRYEELWRMCCGFLDLRIEQFMTIQHRLLLEQIELLEGSELGGKLMHGAVPATVESFRKQVPLTSYVDYCPELLERKEDVLPAEPVLWMNSPGKSGQFPVKRVPFSQRYLDELELIAGAAVIFATCKRKLGISVEDGGKLLCAISSLPCLHDISQNRAREAFDFRFLPQLSECGGVPFEERLFMGYKLALMGRMDGLCGISWMLPVMGELCEHELDNIKPFHLLSQPGAMIRLIKGLVKSNLAGRQMLPKDLWSLRGILSVGADSTVYREKIREMWGVDPLEVYGGTESIMVAVQAWDRNGLTFIPNLNFLEFIPEEEHKKWQIDHSYQPKTVLLDEVEAGKCYELVITNFHGGAIIRYRVGDMIRITALRNEELGIGIPQMVFERRSDDLIDIGLMCLTEKVIWQAVESTGIPYQGWTARKEMAGDKPAMRLYLELKGNYIASERGIAAAVYEEIKKLDDGLIIHQDVASLEKLIDFKPVEVTLLQEGAFAGYMARRQDEGADLAHLKPPHINPSDGMLSQLGARVEVVPEVEVAVEAGTAVRQ